MMPPRPWTAGRSDASGRTIEASRIFDREGREIAVVTKATNEFRSSVEDIAAAIVEAVNRA